MITGLKHVDDEFRFCVNYPVQMSDSKFLFGDYKLFDSEYRYCHHRCLRSLIGGREEDIDIFDKTHEEIRDFGDPIDEKPDTLQGFADTFFEFINSLLFIASADEVVGDIYTTFPPSYVTVFDIQHLFDRIDQQFTDEEGNVLLHDSTLGWTTEEELDKAGEDVFEGEWQDVKGSILVSQDNLSAHPFLFKINYQKVVKKPAGRRPVTVGEARIVYPRFYAKILQYQIFPLLENGDQPSGHDILTQVSTSRGHEFERNLFDYISDQGFQCYHSAEITKNDREEIDILVINEEGEELWFLECKYLLPKTDMNRAEGVEKLNESFNYKVFKEEGAYDSPPTGDPFPEKVEFWMDLDSGDSFSSQAGSGEHQREEHSFQREWTGYDYRMYVVSNLVPSFVEKNGVRFLTDMEFFELLEGEETVYDSKY